MTHNQIKTLRDLIALLETQLTKKREELALALNGQPIRWTPGDRLLLGPAKKVTMMAPGGVKTTNGFRANVLGGQDISDMLLDEPPGAYYAILVDEQGNIDRKHITVMPAAIETPPSVDVGFNLTWSHHWGAQQHFANVLKKCGGFGVGRTEGTRNVLATESGAFPKNTTLIPFASDTLEFPAGEYVLTWDGEGSMTIPQARAVSIEPNRIVYDIGFLRSLSVKAAAGVSNPCLCRTGSEGKKWYEPSIAMLRGSKVIRFMDWGCTNTNRVSDWEDRTHPDSLFQGTGRGVCYEDMISLCEETNTHPWINIPTFATVYYIEQLGKLLSKIMPSWMNVHVEFCGNEFWNFAGPFKVNHVAVRDSEYTPSQQNNDGQKHPATAYAHRMTWQTKALTAYLPRERQVRHVSTKTATPWYAQTTLAELDILGVEYDAIACTAYFGGNGECDIKGDGLHKMPYDSGSAKWFEDAKRNMHGTHPQLKRIAEKHGCGVSIYEGGSHVGGFADGDAQIAAFMVRLERDPRMAAMTRLAIQKLRDIHGDILYLHFSDAAVYDDKKSGGCFGAVEGWSSEYETAPIYKAVIDA